jgi:hypothetical protein
MKYHKQQRTYPSTEKNQTKNVITEKQGEWPEDE